MLVELVDKNLVVVCVHDCVKANSGILYIPRTFNHTLPCADCCIILGASTHNENCCGHIVRLPYAKISALHGRKLKPIPLGALTF